ncbi:hypothetical protein J7I91_16530 [Pseudomonas sp. ISL-84]|nr:hypothetical protein [Pseudomonas sp. ISL-84]
MLTIIKASASEVCQNSGQALIFRSTVFHLIWGQITIFKSILAEDLQHIYKKSKEKPWEGCFMESTTDWKKLTKHLGGIATYFF